MPTIRTISIRRNKRSHEYVIRLQEYCGQYMLTYRMPGARSRHRRLFFQLHAAEAAMQIVAKQIRHLAGCRPCTGIISTTKPAAPNSTATAPATPTGSKPSENAAPAAAAALPAGS